MAWIVADLGAAALFGVVLFEDDAALTQCITRSVRRGG